MSFNSIEKCIKCITDVAYNLEFGFTAVTVKTEAFIN